MNWIKIVVAAVLSSFLTGVVCAEVPSAMSKPPATTHAKLIKAYGNIPLAFEANAGQTDERVKFLTRGAGYNLLLTPTESVMVLRKGRKKEQIPPAPFKKGEQMPLKQLTSLTGDNEENLEPETPPSGRGLGGFVSPREVMGLDEGAATEAEKEKLQTAVIRMKLAGANADAVVSGREILPGKSNYFIGNDPKQWRTNVANYKKVHYKEVYPGIDLLYYGNQRQLEYDFIVAPGADPKAITLVFQGADDLNIDSHGNLVLRTTTGDVLLKAPVIYQEIGGARQNIDGHYLLQADNRVAFHVAEYDTAKPLVIDPMLVYSTYFGGRLREFGESITTDASGNAYVVGRTKSDNIITTEGAFQRVNVGRGFVTDDIFIMKLSADGTLLYSTYFGGLGNETGRGIAVDADGNVYITGTTTQSKQFPITTGAFQTSPHGLTSDGYVMKLSADGSAVIYSTYLGGSALDLSFGIAVDATGNAYVAGRTLSSDFPTTATAVQPTFGGTADCFVTKLSADASSLVYSVYLGGPGFDQCNGIAVDALGNAYVTGVARGGFPTTAGVFQATPSGGVFDGFVTKLSADGSGLIYSTYLGGGLDDRSNSIAVDATGSAYVAGGTLSTNFPTTAGALDTTLGGERDAFVTKLSADGSALVYSTYLGGSDLDSALGIAVDATGNAYVAGRVFSKDFSTTAAAIQPTIGAPADPFSDAFVTKLSADGSALIYSSYLGGFGNDLAFGIAVDASGDVYLTGETFSNDFPTTPGALQVGRVREEDAFITKISLIQLQPGALSVTPSTGISASGEFGGPFTDVRISGGATTVIYTLENTGGEPLDFAFDFAGFRHDSATGTTTNSTWVTVTNGAGTLPAGATSTATVAINSSAASLSAGSYSGTVGITNTTNGSGDTTRPVALQVLVPGSLNASPATGLVSSGLEGGPFSPGSIDYVLTNLGETDVNFHISGVQSWVSLDFVGSAQSSTTGSTAIGGTIQPGATKTVKASINANANALAPNNYPGILTFNHTSQSGNLTGSFPRPVNLEVKKLGELSVTGSDLVSTGERGGPFAPASATYTLTNIGESDIVYAVGKTAGWITLSNAGGTLIPGASATVMASVNTTANGLAAGPFSDTITFTNTTNGRGDTTRIAALNVLLPGTLSVTPMTPVTLTGEFGGPFTSSATYTLTNIGQTSLTYDVSTTLPWLDLGGALNGTLNSGASVSVTAAVNALANSRLPGTSSGGVIFENTKNALGSKSVDWSLVVVDTKLPLITAPVDVTAEATGPQTTVAIGTATATDVADPTPVITSDAPATFPVSTTIVTWTATDASGNTSTATQTVTVTDTTAPAITAPINVTAEATGPQTVVAIGTATATDVADPIPNVTSDAPATFPVGTAIVTWTATDASGNTSTATQTVTVTDTTAPVVTAPADVTASATGLQTTVAIGTATATDAIDPAPVITNNAPATFPVGVTTVTWTATDSAGNVGTATQTITITTSAPTPVGTNVTVNLINSATGRTPAQLMFDQVAQAGNTDLTVSNAGPMLPPGTVPGTPLTYYQIVTTAQFAGSVKVCINYAGISFKNQSSLKLKHFVNGVWQEITTSLDTTNKIICGSTNSFSPFVIVEEGFTKITLDISKAQVKLDRKTGKDKFEVKGDLTLSPGSDGFDFATEAVTLTVNGFSQTLPAGSLVRKDDEKFVFKATERVSGIKKLEIRDDLRFKVKGDRLNLGGFANPADFSLKIGNDLGQAEVLFKIKGEKDDDLDEDKDKKKDKKKDKEEDD